MLKWLQSLSSSLSDLREAVVRLDSQSQKIERLAGQFESDHARSQESLLACTERLSAVEANLSSLMTSLEQSREKFDDAADLARGATRTAQEMVRARERSTPNAWAAR